MKIFCISELAHQLEGIVWGDCHQEGLVKMGMLLQLLGTVYSGTYLVCGGL